MRYVMTWSGNGGAPEGVERQCPVLWREFEPLAGQYDFARIDRMLAAQATPVHLSIVISMYGRETGLADYTPACHQRSLKLVAANGKSGTFPDYANTGWRTAYQRAIVALAERYRGQPQVVGYQVALGLNNETQATVITADGTNWNQPAAKVLDEEGYYTFIRETVAAAVAAWGPTADADGVPVYVPGAPSPGTTWNHKRRDVVVDALKAGGRYLSCGLLTDNSNATGLGVRVGQGMTDIIRQAAGCAFEMAREAGTEALELYWCLLRARHWGADFVQLQRSWFASGHWAAVKDLLPADGAAWLAFRDAEYPAQTWQGADGQTYGQSGEAGCWGAGLRWVAGGTLEFDAGRLDRGRWVLQAGEPVRLDVDAADGPATAIVTYADGETRELEIEVVGGQFLLPDGAGAEYHRVELAPAPAREALPEDEPAATATKVRWWLEELARTQERGETERAHAILYSLIELAYRLEAGT